MNQTPGGWGPQQGQGPWSGQQQGWGPQYGYPQQPPRPPASNTGVIVGVAVIGGLIAFSILTTIAGKSIVAGVVMVLAGIGAVVACVKLKSPPIVRPIAGVSGGVLIVSAALGMSVKITTDREVKAACDRATYELTHAKGGSMPYDQAMAEFDRLTKEADKGIAACKTAGMLDAASGLEAGKKEIERQKGAGEAKAKQEQEEAAKKAAAEALAKREADWPETQKTIKSALSIATARANAGKWLDADAQLSEAQGLLDGLVGTKIEGTPEWTALGKQVDAQRRVVAPQVERIRKKEEDEKAKDAVVAALRGSKPSCGSWSMCASTIKENLNDADSFEFVDSTEVQAEGPSWTCAIKFRAKNAFGAKILDARKCWIQQGNVVKMAKLE